MNYYNEIDPYCVEWLKNLIMVDLIPDGYVDSRPIQEVKPEDLREFTQCHFFAGIAGWPLALQLAGWPADRAVFTGSCPCQPFSVAGKRKGKEDERHLWPEFHRLIEKCKPPTVFGEQVAAATDWLAGVRSDMEALDYAFGAAPIEAACAGAPQYRDRIWFVAGSNDTERRSEESGRYNDVGVTSGRVEGNGYTSERSFSGLSDSDFQCESDKLLQRSGQFSGAGGVAKNSAIELAGQHEPRLERCQGIAGYDGPQCATAERGSIRSLVGDPSNGWGEGWTESEFRSRGFAAAVASLPDGAQFIECPDGKWRRLPPPRVRWLGNGIPARVAKLRAFGNAIVPQVAAEFIKAYMEAEEMLELL